MAADATASSSSAAYLPPALPTSRQDIQATELRGPLGRPPPGGCRIGIGLSGVLYWSSGDGGRLLAALARGRNRFGGGGRGTTKDEAAEEDEEQAADVVIVGAGDDEEYASDKLSGFKGLVLDLSYREEDEDDDDASDDEEFEFRPDVPFKRGSRYSVRGPFDTFLVGRDTAEVSDIKFSNDGKSMLLTTTNNHIYVLDAYGGDKVFYLVAMEKTVSLKSEHVRDEKVKAAWKIFTPLLDDVSGGKLKSVRYKPGTRGPQEADELSKRMGYVQTHGYIWVPTLSKV